MNGKDRFYFRTDIQVEPLVSNWFAWLHLVTPAPAAFNLVNRYISIMSSYVQAPQMHAAAVKNPAMRGGPFIDLGGEHVTEVNDLLRQTKVNNAYQIEFVGAVKALNNLLLEQADGHSLEDAYAEVPDLLRGYVELYYDLNQKVGFRFFESLLYRSPLYNPAVQQVALSVISGDTDRPFILSTPRLPAPGTLLLNVPFSSSGLDELFKMKKTPRSLDYIEKAMGVDIADKELFRSFFTDQPPRPYAPYEADAFRIRYFGHACILLESRDVTILFDPVLSYTYESELARYSYEDLPDHIDYVLITHAHQDHILLETMLQLRHKVGQVVVGRNADGMLQDPSLELLLRNLGFTNVVEMRDLQTISFKGGAITALPFLGEHHDIAIQSKICYHVRIGDKSVLSMADSCNLEPRLYEHVHRLTGDVDVLFLGMECDGAPAAWVYGPLFLTPLSNEKSNTRRGRGSNYLEASDLVERFNCKEVYIYAMGLEPWLQYILGLAYTEDSNPIVQSSRLLEKCQALGIKAERLFGEREILITAPGSPVREADSTPHVPIPLAD